MASKDAGVIAKVEATTATTLYTNESQFPDGTAAPSIACRASDVAPVNLAELQGSVNTLLGHGPYQRSMLVGGILCVSMVITQFTSYQLIGRPVEHWCRPPVELAHLPTDAWKNLSLPIEADGSFSKCTMFDPLLEDTVQENRTVIACKGWEYDIENKGDSIVSRFDLVCNRQFLYPLSSLISCLAYAILTPAAGFVSDRVGRKPVIMVCAAVVVFSVITSSAARTFTFFLINRVLAIAAANGGYILTFILLYEGTGPAQRWLFMLLHTAVAATLVPPIVEIFSSLRPGWMLAQSFIITPAVIFAAWCFLLHESPAWLVATWKLRQAEEAVLLAAKVNGQNVDKARENFRVLVRELRRLHDSQQQTSMATASQGILEAMRMRRLAAAAFFTRFTLSGVYFGLLLTDHAFDYLWLGIFIGLSTTVYWLIILAVNRYGIRETLSAVLAITCGCVVAKYLLILSGDNVLTPFLHALTKAVASGSISLVMGYAGDIFPTKIRCAGVSLSIFFGGFGSLVGVFITKLKGQTEGVFFSMYAALMTMLSVAAVQWLPEVFLEKPNKLPPTGSLGPEGRKLALQSTLRPAKAKKRRKR